MHTCTMCSTNYHTVVKYCKPLLLWYENLLGKVTSSYLLVADSIWQLNPLWRKSLSWHYSYMHKWSLSTTMICNTWRSMVYQIRVHAYIHHPDEQHTHGGVVWTRWAAFFLNLHKQSAHLVARDTISGHFSVWMGVHWSRVSVYAWLESVQVGSAQKINTANNGVVALIAEETSLFLVLDAYC